METEFSEEEIFLAFRKVIPYLPSFFDDEISIALTDKKKFLANQTCQSLQVKSKPGDCIPEGGAAAVAIQLGKVSVKEVSKEIYGVPFKSYAVPLKNEAGEIVGAVLVAKNLQKSKNLLEVSKKLALTFDQISSAVIELTDDIQKLAVVNNEIADVSERTAEYAVGTQEILKFIQRIASQSNLLGLNAAIEAARAGKAGKGFQVVAQEIRKMSVNTTDSIKKISEVLNSIEDSIHHISSGIKDSNSIFQGQIASLEEISASMIELNTTVHTVEELSEKI